MANIVDNYTETYKNHTLGYVINKKSESGFYGTVSCSGNLVNGTKYASGFNTLESCKSRCNNLLNTFKSQIDVASNSGSGNGGESSEINSDTINAFNEISNKIKEGEHIIDGGYRLFDNNGNGNIDRGGGSGGFPGGYSPNWANGNYSTNSVVTFLTSIGIPNSAVANPQPLRGQIYEWLGLGSASSYTGSASQNIAFLQALKNYGQGQGSGGGGGNNGGGNSGSGNNGGDDGNLNWQNANSEEYKGHTITKYAALDGNLYAGKVTCSGPIVNDTKILRRTDGTAVARRLVSTVSDFKAQIDNGGNPDNPNNPTGYPKDVTPAQTKEYKGYSYVTHVQQEDATTYGSYLRCDALNYLKSNYFNNVNSATSGLTTLENAFKTYVDGLGTNPNIPGGGSTGNDAPWPEIVFGQGATTEGGAGSNYQRRRNQGVADMIYNTMQDMTFNSVDSVKRFFWDELMSIVNSHGGNLQIDAQGRISGDNAQDWANTVNVIKQYLFDKFGYTNWNQFVSGGSTPGGGGSGGGNGGSGFTTGSGAADNTWGSIQEGSTRLFRRLDEWYNDSTTGRNDLKNQIDDGYASAISDRLTTLRNSFNGIADQMTAASDLQKKAQRIYSNQNIEKMNQQLRQMGYDPGVAAPAVYYQATKQMANVAIEYYKLAAEEQSALAELEAQKAQLVDNIKAAGIEADQWTKNMLNEVEKQIQNIRDNYVKQKNDILGTWTLQPMLDVMSNQFQADLQNIADMYQDKFVDTYPEMKMIAAARIFGSDWYYCDSSVAVNYNAYSTFGEYLAACAESIKNNKLRAETQVAQAGATIYGNSSSTNGSNNTTTTPTYVYLD